MAATILNSSIAVEASIFVVRAFVKFREMISAHKELTRKLKQLEKKITGHDEDIKLVFEAIKQLMKPPEKKKRKIGFRREKEK